MLNKGKEYKNVSEGDYKDKTFFLHTVVRKSKNPYLKKRLQTLIHARGMSESQFYNSLNLSRQIWYDLSWGRFETSDWLKCKIAHALDTDSCIIWKEGENETE